MKIYQHSKLQHLFLVIFCAGMSLQSFSQDNKESNEQDDKQPSQFWKHVRFGGGIGFNFGDRFFSGTLAPSAIYDVNDQLSLGLGLSGTYNKQRNIFSSTILGGSVISLFEPIQQIQASGELEYLNVNQSFSDSATNDRIYWVPALFIGVGYRTKNITFGIRYDVLYNKDKSINLEPWAPFVRVFF
jgi:long-subunit fatty acid transport protein